MALVDIPPLNSSSSMDGVLVLNKPKGMTSHDAVVAARRLLGERRIGHTGTLDPLATGVLPLACGRATRLVRFLTAADKDYEAVIEFGRATNTFDVTGIETRRTDRVPTLGALTEALAGMQGDQLQMPPPISAKKVHGRRAYELARAEQPFELKRVPVSLIRVAVQWLDGRRCGVALSCSAGFYVRALAEELGQQLGTGACLESLTRSRSGDFTLDTAISIAELHARPDASHLVSINRLLPRFPSVTVTDTGLARVSHGQQLDASNLLSGSAGQASAVLSNEPGWVKMLDLHGSLVALAVPGSTPGSLHPQVVLI